MLLYDACDARSSNPRRLAGISRCVPHLSEAVSTDTCGREHCEAVRPFASDRARCRPRTAPARMIRPRPVDRRSLRIQLLRETPKLCRGGAFRRRGDRPELRGLAAQMDGLVPAARHFRLVVPLLGNLRLELGCGLLAIGSGFDELLRDQRIAGRAMAARQAAEFP